MKIEDKLAFIGPDIITFKRSTDANFFIFDMQIFLFFIFDDTNFFIFPSVRKALLRNLSILLLYSVKIIELWSRRRSFTRNKSKQSSKIIFASSIRSIFVSSYSNGTPFSHVHSGTNVVFLK